VTKPLFGSNTRDLSPEVNPVGSENLKKIRALQAEITQAHEQLEQSEADLLEMRKKLEDYISKERQIAEVMIIAQINAQRIEAEARAKVAILLQETDEELRRKHQQLELLRLKAQHFKKEINERLDEYRSSLERIVDISEDASFKPILITPDKKPDETIVGEENMAMKQVKQDETVAPVVPPPVKREYSLREPQDLNDAAENIEN